MVIFNQILIKILKIITSLILIWIRVWNHLKNVFRSMIMKNLKLIKKLLKIIYKIKKKDSLIWAKKKQLIIYTLNKMKKILKNDFFLFDNYLQICL